MNITRKIEQLRIEKGWSVARLAREANIPTVSLRVMLNRKDVNNYSVDPLRKLADALGVTVSYLVQEEDEDSQKPKLTRLQRDQLDRLIKAAIDEFFDTESQGEE